jgi:hypothetical protein
MHILINKSITVKDQYSFISIPLQLSYTFFAKEKFKISATSGIRSNIVLKGITYLPNTAKDSMMEMKSEFNHISFSYLLALEVAYSLTEHTTLLIQPVSPMRQRLYTTRLLD